MEENFAATLVLVQKLRRDVTETPVFEDGKINQNYTLLKTQEEHLRSLAAQIGPLVVEKELVDEFKEARDTVSTLMPLVLDAPLVVGERHAKVRNPYANILIGSQSHFRGCYALLQKARTLIPEGGDVTFDDLFREPHLRAVGDE